MELLTLQARAHFHAHWMTSWTRWCREREMHDTHDCICLLYGFCANFCEICAREQTNEKINGTFTVDTYEIEVCDELNRKKCAVGNFIEQQSMREKCASIIRCLIVAMSRRTATKHTIISRWIGKRNAKWRWHVHNVTSTAQRKTAH